MQHAPEWDRRAGDAPIRPSQCRGFRWGRQATPPRHGRIARTGPTRAWDPGLEFALQGFCPVLGRDALPSVGNRGFLREFLAGQAPLPEVVDRDSRQDTE